MRAAEKSTRIPPPHRDLAADLAQDGQEFTPVCAWSVSVNESRVSTVWTIKYFPQSLLQRRHSDGRATLRPIVLQQSGKAVVTSRKRNYVVAPAEF